MFSEDPWAIPSNEWQSRHLIAQGGLRRMLDNVTRLPLKIKMMEVKHQSYLLQAYVELSPDIMCT